MQTIQRSSISMIKLFSNSFLVFVIVFQEICHYSIMYALCTPQKNKTTVLVSIEKVDRGEAHLKLVEKIDIVGFSL